ncbi:MAG: helix-turn-helix domain-containing protein [Thiogranum sp.]
MYSIFEICEPDPPYYGVTPVKPDTTLRERLARNVRLLRVMRGWSQEVLALEARLDRTYVGAVERAERNLTLSSMEKLAKALDVEVKALLAAS